MGDTFERYTLEEKKGNFLLHASRPWIFFSEVVPAHIPLTTLKKYKCCCYYKYHTSHFRPCGMQYLPLCDWTELHLRWNSVTRYFRFKDSLCMPKQLLLKSRTIFRHILRTCIKTWHQHCSSNTICGWLHKCQPKASMLECLTEMSRDKIFAK
jgi:hypothetical protein